MARVLSISSQVVYGHVGNSITAFVLQRFGHEVLAAPTVMLSNRPGYAALASLAVPAANLDGFLQAMSRNGWLDGLDAIITGYLPTPGHVEVCADWIKRLKRQQDGLFYLCDPILGDDHTGVYIDEAAARSLRDSLVPICDLATPNAFELGWLSGQPVTDAGKVMTAARSLNIPGVIVTSAPSDNGPAYLANVLIEGSHMAQASTPRRQVHAHGTGDFFAAQFLAHRLNGGASEASLKAAALAMDTVLDASADKNELALVESQSVWSKSI